jgi:hypothetical protein
MVLSFWISVLTFPLENFFIEEWEKAKTIKTRPRIKIPKKT